MLCKKCGYSNDDNNKFCQECGAPMGDTAPEVQTANAEPAVSESTENTVLATNTEPAQEPVSEPAPTVPQDDFNPNPTNPNPVNPNPTNPNPVNPQNNGYNPNPVNPQGGYNPNMAGGNPNFNPNMPNGYPAFDPVAEKNARDAENLALWSMICGIASFFCCSFGIVLSILSIVLGVMAKRKGCTSNKATAGIALGIIGLAFAVVGIIFSIISNISQAAAFEEAQAIIDSYYSVQ